MAQNWMPGAERFWNAQSGGNTVGGEAKVTHHITTGGGFDFLEGYLIARGYEPTLLVDPVSGRIGQFLSAANSGYALRVNGPETNRQGSRHIQIEWCWDRMANRTLDHAPKWAEVWHRVLDFCRQNGVPDHKPFGSLATASSRDPALWVKGGHACHFNAPGNDHSDGLPVSDESKLWTPAGPAPRPPANPSWYQHAMDVQTPILRGPDVKHVQQVIGMPVPWQDGIYGSTTKHWVFDWQRKHGLVADGIVGPATARAMK